MPVADARRLRPDAAPAAPPISVECIDDVWGFTALRPQWNELLRASDADGPFLTWDWLDAWWTHLRGSAELRLVTVRAGHQLIAVAPLLVSGGRLAWFSRLELLGTGHAGSDYLDVIVRRGHEAESLRAIAGVIAADARTLRLDHVRPAAQASRLAERLEAGGWHAAVTPGGVCPVIHLAGHTWDSYLATIGSSHRANIRRRLRALDQRFHVRFEQATTDEARREALAALVGYHERRWEDRGGSTAFFTPALRAFHDDATRRALDRGWLRMYVLRLNDAPAAVMYGFFYDRQFYFYQHGFDDQYRQHSAGLALMALSVRAAIDEGADTFDMLWGTESYKALWAQDRRLLQQIHLFPPDLGGRLHRRAIAARRRLGTLARRVLTARLRLAATAGQARLRLAATAGQARLRLSATAGQARLRLSATAGHAREALRGT